MTGGAVALRPVRVADSTAIAGLVGACFEEYREIAPDGWEPPPQQAAAERVESGLGRPGAGGTVAEADGAHAGHVLWLPSAQARRFAGDDPEVAYLWQLFVDPSHRGGGLAAVLLASAVEGCSADGFAEMRLLTPRDQARARAFYAREGWSLLGDWGMDPDLGLPLVEFGRRLRSPVGTMA